MKQLALSLILLLLPTLAFAAQAHEPVKSHIELAPGQKELVTVPATGPLEIGWEATQTHKCTMHCVQATDKSGNFETSIATDLGASMKYQPVNGRIVIEYENKADHPVTIDVYQLKRTCDAEACAFVHEDEKTRWLVFKVDEFTSIETSKDKSYSTISGLTVAGKPFTVKAIWWTDNDAFTFPCPKFIQDYLDRKVPKAEYTPYIISGSAIGEKDDGKEVILKSVDTCVPKAPHFGVPPENVF